MRIHENPNIIVLQDVGSKFNSSKIKLQIIFNINA